MEPKRFSISNPLVNPITGKTPGEEFDLIHKKRWLLLLVWALLSLLLVLGCALLTSSTAILLGSLGIWMVTLLAGWKFQRGMQRHRISNPLLEEELLLDNAGYHWKQNSPHHAEVHIAWSEISEICPGEHIKYGANKTITYPRIAYDDDKEEIMNLILQQGVQQAGLHKSTRKEYEPRNRVYYDKVYYVRENV